jgi:TRAP-type C4-dicarboxylate transport system permease small subunit
MRIVRWIDANIERVIILVAYVTMAAIMFVEVIRRFLFSEQAAWSTTIPIYMFLWIVWIACAYNVRIRAHLSFDEVRAKLPRTGQFLCLMLDSVLWIIFSLIVIYYTWQQVMLSRDNFAIVMGTDEVMQWWFYIGTPLAFSLLIVRVVQNIAKDVSDYRSGRPLKVQTGIFGD